MNKSQIAKICGVLCILGVIAGFSWVIIDNGSGIIRQMVRNSMFAEGEFNDASVPMILMFSSLAVLTSSMFLGFAGYFFSGALGEKLFGKIIFGIVAVVTVVNVSVSVFGLIYFISKTEESSTDALFGLFFLVIPFFQLMLLVFGITALVVGRANTLKSLMPLATLAGYIAVPVFLFLLYSILTSMSPGTVGEVGRFMYNVALKATIPHWSFYGAIAWILMGIAPFMNNKELNPAE